MSKPDLRPPACASARDIWAHCWHFPRGFWPSRHEDEPGEPETTLTCCDCGEEATTHTFNREAGTHGKHRQGEPYERRQHRFAALVRLLPKLRKATAGPSGEP